LYITDSLGIVWRPQRDLNSCRRRERPILSVLYLILRPSMSVERRLCDLKAVQKAVIALSCIAGSGCPIRHQS